MQFSPRKYAIFSPQVCNFLPASMQFSPRKYAIFSPQVKKNDPVKPCIYNVCRHRIFAEKEVKRSKKILKREKKRKKFHPPNKNLQRRSP